MSLMGAVSNSIAKFGGDVEITQGSSSVRTRAIVEPLRYRNKIYIGGEQRKIYCKKVRNLFCSGQTGLCLGDYGALRGKTGGRL